MGKQSGSLWLIFLGPTGIPQKFQGNEPIKNLTIQVNRLDEEHIRIISHWEYCQSTSIENVLSIVCVASTPTSVILDYAQSDPLFNPLHPTGCNLMVISSGYAFFPKCLSSYIKRGLSVITLIISGADSREGSIQFVQAPLFLASHLQAS